MKKILAFLFVVFLSEVSTAQKHVVTYYDYSKIHPKADYYVNSVGQKNGPYKEYTQDGVVVEESNYLNGFKNGLCVTYWVGDHNQRTVSGRVTYKNGELDGPYTGYNRDGVPFTSGNYVNGKKEGKWTTIQPFFDSDYGEAPEGFGSVKFVEDFKADVNVTTGKVRTYFYPSGKLCMELEMKNGEDASKSSVTYYPNGVLKIRNKTDSTGNVTSKEVYYPTGKTFKRQILVGGNWATDTTGASWAFTAQGDTTAQMKKSMYDYSSWKKASKPVPVSK